MVCAVTVRVPIAQHMQTIILLHGRDSIASEFAEELLESQATDGRTLPQILPGLKWVFPTAPMLPAARFGNSELSQWFDMWSTECPHLRDDEQQFDTQVSWIQRLILEEADLVGPQNLFIGGISQGCVVALHALLKQEKQLAGFIGLCSWSRQEKSLRNNAHLAALQTPVLLGHHQDDNVIDVKYGEELRNQLTDIGMRISWKCYRDEAQEPKHWLNEPEGVEDIVKFVNKETDSECDARSKHVRCECADPCIPV